MHFGARFSNIIVAQDQSHEPKVGFAKWLSCNKLIQPDSSFLGLGIDTDFDFFCTE
jgi:hypothetical protein